MKFQLGIDIVNYKNNYKGKITSRFCVTVILPCDIQEILQKLHIQSPNASAVLEINVTDDFNCDELQAYIENMQAKKGLSIDELIKMVSSPGGTTLAGLDALYEGKLTDTVNDACERCTKRAYELSK